MSTCKLSFTEPDEHGCSGSKLYRQEVEERERRKYRTECWLERCIYEERICSADEHPSFTPLDIETPVEGAENIHLSVSGFDESESWALRRLIRALGLSDLLHGTNLS